MDTSADTGEDATDSGGEDVGEDASVDAGEDTHPPSSCPQADDFQDVSGASAGEGYPAPELAVTCEDDEVVVVGNGIPNFEFIAITPSDLAAQENVYRFPREPTVADDKAAVPLLGPAAVAVNGLPIYGPTESEMMGYRDPTLDAILDFCNGHTGMGRYHFHSRPECLFTDFEGNTSLVVAYSFDGYPILAPFVCVDAECTMVEKVESSWQPIAERWMDDEPVYRGTEEGAWDVFEYVAGSGDLDRCNGRELPGGGYAYYSTDTFPYFIGCYHGVPTNNRGGGGMMTGTPDCGPGVMGACCGNDVCNAMRGETPMNCPEDCP